MIDNANVLNLQAKFLGGNSVVEFLLRGDDLNENETGTTLATQFGMLTVEDNRLINFNILHFPVSANFVIKELQIRQYFGSSTALVYNEDLLVTFPLPETTTITAGIYTINRVSIIL